MILVQRLKQRRSRVAYTCRFEIGVQLLLRFMVQPDKLFLIALFEEAQPGAFVLQGVIPALQFQDGAHTREGIRHDRDDGAVAQSFDISLSPNAPALFPRNLRLSRYRDGIEQLAHLIGLQDERDADLHAEFRSLDEERQVIGNACLMTSQLKSPRSAARCCLTEGAVSALLSI